MRRSLVLAALLAATGPAAAIAAQASPRPSLPSLFSGEPFVTVSPAFAFTGRVAEGLFHAEGGLRPPEDVTGLTAFIRARRLVGYGAHTGSTLAMAGLARVTRARAYRMVLGLGSYGRRGWDLMTLEGSGTAGRFRLDLRTTWFRDSGGFDVDSMLIPGSGITAPVRRDPYSEAELLWAVPSYAVEITAAMGGRLAQSPTEDEAWAYASAAWPTPLWSGRLALVSAIGWRPSSPEINLPGGRFASIGLRFSLTPVTRVSAPPPLLPTAPEGGLEIRPHEDNGTHVLRIRLPRARSVELRGDFTDWQPRTLTRTADGTWELELPLEPGTYRLEMRIDAGPWTVPPGVVSMPDGFGGHAGIIEIR